MIDDNEKTVAELAHRLHSLSRKCNNPYLHDSESFEFKKDLYLIKDLVDDALASTKYFGEMEHQWLTERDKKRIIKILKS